MNAKLIPKMPPFGPPEWVSSTASTKATSFRSTLRLLYVHRRMRSRRWRWRIQTESKRKKHHSKDCHCTLRVKVTHQRMWFPPYCRSIRRAQPIPTCLAGCPCIMHGESSLHVAILRLLELCVLIGSYKYVCSQCIWQFDLLFMLQLKWSICRSGGGAIGGTSMVGVRRRHSRLVANSRGLSFRCIDRCDPSSHECKS